MSGDDSLVTVLTAGSLELTGRLTDASNVTLVGTVTADGVAIPCVYKPVRGERPLWDFPEGTLAGREIAAFELSVAAGWHCVPLTVQRDGPLGAGMVQQWIPDAEPDRMTTVVAPDELPDGWLPVLRAEDADGRPLLVAHADDPALRTLAGFDLVVNNADRKGSHILATADGRVRGVDHGLTFHQHDKLRTILWGWAGEPLPDDVLDGLGRLTAALAAGLGERLAGLISAAERDVLAARIDTLRRTGRFPMPPQDRTPIPWPPL